MFFIELSGLRVLAVSKLPCNTSPGADTINLNVLEIQTGSAPVSVARMNVAAGLIRIV